MKYAAKKTAMMLLTMVIVSFLAFLAFQIIPGDAAVNKLGSDATVEAVEALRHEMGLDRPFFVRYGEWVLGALRGDFGASYSYSMSVSQMLAGKLPITALLTALAFLLIVVISIPLGIFTAGHAGGRFDKALTVANQVLMAVPPFFTGVLLTLIFGLTLRWFTPGAFVAPEVSFWRSVGYLMFPAVSIALPRNAMTVKMLKGSILTELERDYVRTSYSRGNSRRTTLYRQTMFAEFELRIAELSRAGQTLTADLLCEEYRKLNEAYYGPDVVLDENIALEWARIPHFYYNYYVFQYATGYSAAIALSQRILAEGEPAVRDYLGFLSGGCSKTPIERLRGAGVDMTKPQPVESALKLFGELLDEMEALLL